MGSEGTSESLPVAPATSERSPDRVTRAASGAVERVLGLIENPTVQRLAKLPERLAAGAFASLSHASERQYGISPRAFLGMVLVALSRRRKESPQA